MHSEGLWPGRTGRGRRTERAGYKTTTVRSRPIHTASAARRDEATYVRVSVPD